MAHTFRRPRPRVQHLSTSDYHQQCVNTPGGPIGNELEIRSLRYFVVAAEELNFTRAAARLFVAQQALSREIKRLETQLGTTLFIRTTRRVTLTPDGERLLVRARDLVARHDAVWADVHVPAAQPTVVDLMSGGRFTATRILDLARQRAPGLEFRGRYTGGTGVALESLAAGGLDVVLGRVDWLDAPPMPTIDRVLVRLEPLAVLLPAAHPLAQHEAVPVRSLQGLEIDGVPSHSQAPEWTDLITQFFALSGSHSTPPHLTAIGLEEQGYHLVRQGVPILASADHHRRPRRRAPPAGGSGPALRLVDGVAARCRGRRHLRAPWRGGRARGRGRLASDGRQSGSRELAAGARRVTPGQRRIRAGDRLTD